MTIQSAINRVTQGISRAIGYRIELKCARDYWDLLLVLRVIVVRSTDFMGRKKKRSLITLSIVFLGLILGATFAFNWWHQGHAEQALQNSRQELIQLSKQLSAQDSEKLSAQDGTQKQDAAITKNSLVQNILNSGATIEQLDRVGVESATLQTSNPTSGQAINLTIVIKPEQMSAVLAVLTQSDIQELDIQPHDHDIRIRAHVYADMNL